MHQTFIPHSPQREPNLLTLCSWTSSLQNCGRIHFCSLRHPVSGTLLWQRQQTPHRHLDNHSSANAAPVNLSGLPNVRYHQEVIPDDMGWHWLLISDFSQCLTPELQLWHLIIFTPCKIANSFLSAYKILKCILNPKKFLCFQRINYECSTHFWSLLSHWPATALRIECELCIASKMWGYEKWKPSKEAFWHSGYIQLILAPSLFLQLLVEKGYLDLKWLSCDPEASSVRTNG